MRELGLDSFRFSIAWPRILPEGRGRVNAAGLDFYDRLVDALLASGIQPCVTLYHWDLPQALEDRGGWPARETVDAFAEYAEVVARRLGDRVAPLDHAQRAVGRRLARLRLGRARARAGERARTRSRPPTTCCSRTDGRSRCCAARRPARRSGSRSNLMHDYPASDAEEDVAAARHVDGFRNRWFLDPLFRGDYPADMLEHFAASAAAGRGRRPGDDRRAARLPRRQLLLAGVIGAGPTAAARSSSAMPDAEYTDMGWEVYPDGLYDLLVRLRDDYAPAADLRSPRTAPRSATCPGTTARARPGAAGVPREPPRRGRPRDRGRRARARATSSGRCSTTSSGPTATPSASGSSTSTTRRSSACRRRASSGTATSSRGNARRPRPRPQPPRDERLAI